MQNLTISQVARTTNLRTWTLRYYERIGLLPRAKRVNGCRNYSPSVLDEIALIGFAKKAGFTLKEISALKNAKLRASTLQRSWREMAETKNRALELVISRAQQSKIQLEMLSQCHCRDIEECSRRIATLQRKYDFQTSIALPTTVF
jgi:MerR family transcriptional regulator, redox-sensitive transcriptional activator SoxR